MNKPAEEAGIPTFQTSGNEATDDQVSASADDLGYNENFVSFQSYQLYARTSGTRKKSDDPVIICLHGSGYGSDYWQEFCDYTSKMALTLRYDRAGWGESSGPQYQTPAEAVRDLYKVLDKLEISPPYIYIAHSYGGRIAREIFQHHVEDVAGAVLAETGQETVAKFDREQKRRHILRQRPLSVIRGNFLLDKNRQHHMGENDVTESAQQTQQERQFIEQWEAEDRKSKMEQLRLSKNAKFVEWSDVGHDVIMDRPKDVAEEVRWVLEQIISSADEIPNRSERIRDRLRSVLDCRPQ
ncbi:MAG: hypothetical protein Q9227_006556 [Pyrenula ochraceoflavens]